MPSAMSLAPRSPSADLSTIDAGVDVAASPSTPSTRRQTSVTARYRHDHADHTDQQSARQISARVAHLAAHEARRLPAAVGEQHRHHCRAESGDATGSVRKRGRRDARRARREEQSDDDEHPDRRELRDHQRRLHVASCTNAEAIHQREDAERDRRDRLLGHRPSRQLARVAPEDDRRHRPCPRFGPPAAASIHKGRRRSDGTRRANTHTVRPRPAAAAPTRRTRMRRSARLCHRPPTPR